MSKENAAAGLLFKKTKLLAIAACVVVVLVLLVFLFPQQPEQKQKSPVARDGFLSVKEDFVPLPETVSKGALQVSERKLLVLADENDFDSIKAIIESLQSSGFEVDFAAPAGFDAKKESSLILCIFSPESSSALQEIVLPVLSDEELALVKKSRQPFSLIKENVFAQGQQVAFYLGRKKSDAIRIFENSFKPKTGSETKEFEPPPSPVSEADSDTNLAENTNTAGNKGKVSFAETAMQENNGAGKLNFAEKQGAIFLAGMSPPEVDVDDIFEYYQEHYQEIDEYCPSEIWDFANCAIVARGCDATSGAYIFASVTDPKGIHFPSDVADLPDGVVLARKEPPPGDETVELTAENFPYCFTYESSGDIVANQPASPYFAFLAEVIQVVVPRCIEPPPTPNVVSYLYWNYLMEINYSAHYAFWAEIVEPWVSRNKLAPQDGFYEHNSSPLVLIPTRDYNSVDFKSALDYYEIFTLKENYNESDMQNRNNWDITKHDIGKPAFIKTTDVAGNTAFFQQITRPTFLRVHYMQYYKLTLQNRESWVGGSNDYADKDFVENYLLQDDAWVKNEGYVTITAPSFNSSGQQFVSWYVDGIQPSIIGSYTKVDRNNPRQLTVWIFNEPSIIEARYEQNFTLQPIPNVSFVQGETKEIDINISSATGINTEVKIETSKESENGLGYELSQSTFPSIPANGKVTAKLKISTTYNTMPSQNYAFKVKVSSGGKQQEQTFKVEVVQKSWNLVLSPSNSPQQINAGETAVYNMEVRSENGFNLPVTLSATGLPAGANYSFSENPVQPNPSGTKTVQLSITTSASTQVGSYVLKILGSTDWFNWHWASEGNKATTAVTLHVSSQVPAGGDFSFNLSPETATVTIPGNDLTFTITITPTEGFSTQVYISVENLPPYAGAPVFTMGSTTFYQTDPVTLPANSSVLVTMHTVVSGTTPNGDYTFTVTVSGGGKTHSQNGHIIVNV
jgi:hypothetical protein